MVRYERTKMLLVSEKTSRKNNTLKPFERNSAQTETIVEYFFTLILNSML